MPEVIDLLSSDPAEPLPSSPPRYQVTASHWDSFLRLSDDIEAPDVDKRTTPAPNKRRRLTPPVEKPASAVYVPRRSPRTAKARSSVDLLDPIVLSSPPGERRPRNHVPKSATTNVAKTREPFDIFDEFDETPQKPPASSVQYSAQTAALLVKLDNNRGKSRNGKTATATSTAKPVKVTTRKKAIAAPLSSIEDPSSQMAPPPAKCRTRLTTPEKELKAKEKVQEKEAAAAAKAVARAEKQRDKQLAADLVEVNKARHDKKISVGEMVLRMPEKFFEQNIGRLTEDVLKQLGVQVEMDVLSVPEELANVLTWKRKVRARFDEDVGHWVPLGRMEMREEHSHILCMLESGAFVKMVQQDAFDTSQSVDAVHSLNAHAKMLRRRWSAARPIYLVQGLETFMRKSRNTKNRDYQAAVRAQSQADGEANSTQNKRKRKKDDAPSVDDDMVEEALLRLQVEHNCLIYHTSSAPETAEWIGNFTQHISTIPYKTQQSTVEASFCMDVGQVKTGEDKDDTFVKMLQEMVRVTLPVAHGVATRYPSVVKLVRAMREQGPALLEDLQKCNNKDGSFSNARIGTALSKRIYKVFMGSNPESMDV